MLQRSRIQSHTKGDPKEALTKKKYFISIKIEYFQKYLFCQEVGCQKEDDVEINFTNTGDKVLLKNM